MPFTVIISRTTEFVRFDAAGTASLKNYFDLIAEAAVETAGGDRRALVDLRNVAGRLVFTDQFFIGEVVAQKLAHLDRVAALVRDDPGTYNSPTVALKRGLNLRVFSDEGAAVRWLQPEG